MELRAESVYMLGEIKKKEERTMMVHEDGSSCWLVQFIYLFSNMCVLCDFKMKWSGCISCVVEQKKCEQYFSELPGGTFETDAMMVTTLSVVPYADFEIKKLTVKNVSGRRCAKMWCPLTTPLPLTHRRQNLIQSHSR